MQCTQSDEFIKHGGTIRKSGEVYYSPEDDETFFEVIKTWIRLRLEPSGKWFHRGSYGMKHKVENDLNIYCPEDVYCQAMKACGYEEHPKQPGIFLCKVRAYMR